MALLTGILLAAATVSASLDQSSTTHLDPDLRYHLGSYLLPGGTNLTLVGDDGKPRALTYVLDSAWIGKLREVGKGSFRDGELALQLGACTRASINVTRRGRIVTAKRLVMRQLEVSFSSGDVRLHGKLVLPPRGRAKALAVWIEGSNNDPSTDVTVWQYEMARRGIAMFVYDKRGAGASGGSPSSDFFVRARDTVAALTAAKRLAPHIRRVGVIGGSQGGWIAPLAATLAKLDFMVAAFAMAEGSIAQDRELVQMQVKEAGYGEDALAGARALTDITEHIVRSNLTDGFAELEYFKARHHGEAWLKAIAPRSYTGLFLLFSAAEIKANGPAMAQGLTFDFEPLPVIAVLKSPQLWLFGANDRQAPNSKSRELLAHLRDAGHDVSIVVFPGAGHGLTCMIDDPPISRTRFAEGVFDKTAVWISGPAV